MSPPTRRGVIGAGAGRGGAGVGAGPSAVSLPGPIAPGVTFVGSNTPVIFGGGNGRSGASVSAAVNGAAAGLTGDVGRFFGGAGGGGCGIFGVGASSRIIFEFTTGASARTPSTSSTASPSACSATETTTV